MKSFNLKRMLSLMLVVMMTITILPLHAFALDDHGEHSENGTLAGIDSKPFEETILLKQIKADIAKLLEKYLGKLVMSEDDVKNALAKYHKGSLISVKGFVSQRNIPVEKDGKEISEHKNTYYITTFLTSEMEVDMNEVIE